MRTPQAMITEFHIRASPLEARMRTHAAMLRALDLDTEQIQEHKGPRPKTPSPRRHHPIHRRSTPLEKAAKDR